MTDWHYSVALVCGVVLGLGIMVALVVYAVASFYNSRRKT